MLSWICKSLTTSSWCWSAPLEDLNRWRRERSFAKHGHVPESTGSSPMALGCWIVVDPAKQAEWHEGSAEGGTRPSRETSKEGKSHLREATREDIASERCHLELQNKMVRRGRSKTTKDTQMTARLSVDELLSICRKYRRARSYLGRRKMTLISLKIGDTTISLQVSGWRHSHLVS